MSDCRLVPNWTSSRADPEYPPKLPAVGHSSDYARWTNIRLDGSAYFVGQRAKTSISRMKFVDAVIFSFQRSRQIDVEPQVFLSSRWNVRFSGVVIKD